MKIVTAYHMMSPKETCARRLILDRSHPQLLSGSRKRPIKGFGFVEMPVQAQAQSAIAFKWPTLKGRTITLMKLALSLTTARQTEEVVGDRRGRRRY
jgi:hypothetical protein